MTSLLVIRRAREQDAAELSVFAERVFVEAFGAQNDPIDLHLYTSEAFTPARQRDEIEAADRAVLLADCEGQLAGYAMVRMHATHTLVQSQAPMELQRFYVDAAWHGRGIAQTLMDAVVQEAQTQGADTLWLGVWELNPRAIRFYEKQGFMDVGFHEFLLGHDLQRDRVLVRAITAEGAA